MTGADGITVDLNGHTISGQIISGGGPGPGQDLTLDFFGDFAVQLEGGSANRITGNRVDRPGPVGIGILGTAAVSRDNVISGNLSTSANSANIALRSGAIRRTVVRGNQLEENFGGDPAQCTGVRCTP